MSSEYMDDPTLVPDEDMEDQQYRWDEEFQRHIIALFVSDRNFFLQSLDTVKSSYFTNKAHQKTCSILFDYFKKYKVLPTKAIIAQEIKNDLKDNKSLPYYLGEVNVLYEYFQPGLEHREYLQDKIAYFAKMQSFKAAFNSGLKLMEKNPESEETWARIHEEMRKAMMTDRNFEIGVNYLKTIKERYERMAEQETGEERFILGLPSIDREIKGGGYPRGSVVSIVADSGVGKSVMLACITATNLLRGKKGVYISLEISEDEVAERLDAILAGLPVQTLLSNKEQIWEKLENLKGVNYEDEMTLVIKQFPAKSADVNTLRAYINQLKFHNFTPDFVIVDYIGEMKHHPDMKTYESRELLASELHALGVEEKVFIATAMQPNRGSKDAQQNTHKHIGQEHLADAYGSMRPLTGCIMLMQNDSENRLGIGRGWVEKQRSGKSKYMVYLQFDKQTLRITEITRDAYMEAMNAQKEYVSEEVKIDAVVKGYKPGDENSINSDDDGEE